MFYKIKKLIFFSFNIVFNFLYQKIKYKKNFLYSAPLEEISKHKNNFYENQISFRKKTILKDSFNLNINKFVFDNSISLIDPRNPLVLTAKEVIAKPNIILEETSLYQFFQKNKPNNLMEAFFLNNINYNFLRLKNLSQYTLFYPWFHKYPQKFLSPGMFGPKDKSVPNLRFIRIKNLISLIKKHGYLPSNKDQISGYKLILKKDFRFVITAGTHRSSVIKALNHNTLVQVKFDDLRIKEGFFKIYIEEIENWPGVSSGYIGKREAEKLFMNFFEKEKCIK